MSRGRCEVPEGWQAISHCSICGRGDAEALALVGHILKTPKVRTRTVETIILRASDTGY
jgi:hypothetical protein